MKKLFKFTTLLSIFFITTFISCNSQYNEDIMFNTVGAKLKKTAPGEVIDLSVTPGDCSATLNWSNPSDIDLFGVTIYVTCNDPEVVLPDPVTLSNKNNKEIPSRYTFYGLTNDKSYTFTCRTFNTNLIYSPGWGLATTPTTNLSGYHVSNLKVIEGDSCVHVSWVNETIEENKPNTIMPDLEGVLISYSEIIPIYQKDSDEIKDIKYTNTKSITLQKTNGIIPTEYTIYELKNGTNYAFSIKQFDKNLNYSTTSTSSTSPRKKTHNLKISNTKANKYDSAVSLSWTNPTDSSFYGLKIESNPPEGNLNAPVYFMDTDQSKIPCGFEVTGLRNNVTYDFTITVIDREMYLSSTAASVSGTPTPTSNSIEVSNLTAMTSTGCVTLYWKKPSDISNLKEYELTVSPYLQKITIPIDQENYALSNLENGTSYSFTIRTIDTSLNRSEGISVEAIPNTGSSGIFNSPDLITYKKDKKAYDFGFCNKTETKRFTFISSSEMDLSKTSISKIMGNDKSYNFISWENLSNPNNPNNSIVNITDEFAITVSYTPSTNSPSWDEADIYIGGKSQNAIRLIGSSYKQPKNITPENLKIWLRADMIKESDLSNGAIKTVPDYSGNNNNANCPDTSYKLAPDYEESWQKLNNLPAINFNVTGKTNSQLLILGKEGKPVIQTKQGITCFIVYYMDSPHSAQGLLSTNYGTSFPTLVAHSRYFNSTGFYVSGDYKTALAVKGNGLSGTWRWPCINTSTTDENNHMLIFGSPTTASDISDHDNIATTALSVCTVFDQTKSNLKINNDFPSNIRMFINNDERLLGYIWSNDSNYSKQKLNDSLLSSDGLTTNGSYGMPWGDGKGHRYGSLTDVKKPSSVDSTEYEAWKTQAEKGNNIGKRKFDRAYNINSSASNSSYTTSSNSERDYFENWILPDTWRNGTINILTIGADSITATNCYSQIAEIIIYDRKLEDDEIKIVNDYITNRYNIQTISTNTEDYIKK